MIGPWGSGKSTILGILERRLDGDDTIAVVSTRPWEFDPALDVKATLIGQVLAKVRPLVEAEEGAEGKLHDLGRKLAERINWTKALTIGAKTALTLQLPSWDAVQDVIKSPDGGDEASDPTLTGFRKEFEQFLSSSERVTRVVVLVDDLDRCLPDTVVSILEGIKLFLAVPKMAFVIAYDEAPVVDAIKDRYKQSDDKAKMAKQYLEKIVQIPVRVPNLGRYATEAYLASRGSSPGSRCPRSTTLPRSPRVLAIVGAVTTGMVVVSGLIALVDVPIARDRIVDAVVSLAIIGWAAAVWWFGVAPDEVAAGVTGVAIVAYFALRHRLRSLLARATFAHRLEPRAGARRGRQRHRRDPRRGPSRSSARCNRRSPRRTPTASFRSPPRSSGTSSGRRSRWSIHPRCRPRKSSEWQRPRTLTSSTGARSSGPGVAARYLLFG